ncbi:protein BIG GRAIN 1 [Brachypodium distachyon]|uniref:Uncharacterized protein n=1 Tax=Brachypodium distachyon TaxID=15368 RepID=A0A0Q3MBG9_BRADI|nr:protein BIG GRAIN 1 [Brachypodium distachyon]KQK01646.1 hypothetical protein BRADI_3g57311v3 [Brachypodium distachyon]|eukprot:XP_003573020.1 protein BIG GRAIN 1 [Brachypodium distachyon]
MSGRLTPPPPRRDREHHPSFSAALLDAIYHSLDADAHAAAPRTPTDHHRRAGVASPSSPRASSSQRPHPGCPATTRRRYSSSTASSSSPSARSPRRPCRVRPDPLPPSLLLSPIPPPPEEKQRNCRKKKKKKKKKTKKKSKSSARFLSCLNALLCNRKPPVAEHPTAAAARAEKPDPAAEPMAEIPASARSILSSRASWRESAAVGGQMTPARRAVRFSPVVVADEERRREREACRTGRTATAEAERRVEELLRALGAGAAEEMRERERAKESSESSSDLFELESFAAAAFGFDDDDDSEMAPRTRARAASAAGLAPPRPRVLLDEMVV